MSSHRQGTVFMNKIWRYMVSKQTKGIIMFQLAVDLRHAWIQMSSSGSSTHLPGSQSLSAP